MHASEESKQVWIGLAHIRQRPGAGVLMDENEAWVQILAMGASAAEYRAAAVDALDHLGFDLQQLEDVDPLEQRLRSFAVDESLIIKAAEVRETGFARFGPFVTWVSND
jgi:hypothetical protein